jgi:hypothetical protein
MDRPHLAQIQRPDQRSLRDRPVLLHSEFDLHRITNRFLRHYFALHGGAATVLHVLDLLNSLAKNIFARHHPESLLQLG